MAILTNDDSLAWTLSDNTSGSNKSKRGGGKIKAVTTQDTWTNSISKYLGASAKMDHDNAARRYSFQEQQLKLEERKMAFQEEQLEYQKRMEQQQQYHGRGYGYGIAYGEPRSHVSPSIPVRQDHQPYDRYGYGIAYGGQRSDVMDMGSLMVDRDKTISTTTKMLMVDRDKTMSTTVSVRERSYSKNALLEEVTTTMSSVIS